MSFRVRGFLIHLSASVVLALLTILIVYKIWYPAPLDIAVGVTSIFFILLGVDVVIGPLLTLAVCKEGKKTLVFDLSVIIAFQLAAFIYGVHTIAQGRPVFIAFNKDRFDMAQAFEMENSFREKATPEYQTLSWTGPRWVAVKIPEDRKIIMEGMFQDVDIPQRADLYEPLNNQRGLIQEKAIALSDLNNFNSADEIKKELAAWPSANAFLPLKGPQKSFVVLIKRETAEIIAVVPLQPWK